MSAFSLSLSLLSSHANPLYSQNRWLPDNRVGITLHFLLHGVHHYLPMDKYRLVMPPTLFAALQFPFTQLAYKLFPVAMANGIIAGAFTFCACRPSSWRPQLTFLTDVLYDCMHYAYVHSVFQSMCFKD